LARGGKERQLLNFPLLIVSSADDVETIRAAFAGGAIDFLSKPLRRALLIVKVERALGVSSVPFEGLVIDAKRMPVRSGSITVGLTSKEMQVMSVLWTAPRRAVSRQELCEELWPRCHVGRKTLDVHLSRLRTKLDGLAVDFESRSDHVLLLRHGEQPCAIRPSSPSGRPMDTLEIDAKRKTVSAKGVRIELTSIQLAMVSLLWNAPGRALSRKELKESLWPRRCMRLQILALQLTRLKRKLRWLDIELESCGERVALRYVEARDERKRTARSDELRIDHERRTVSAGGAVVELTEKQMQIVSLLRSAPHHVLTRDELIKRAWSGGTAAVKGRTLAVLLSRLRRKLNVLNIELSARDDRVSLQFAEHADPSEATLG